MQVTPVTHNIDPDDNDMNMVATFLVADPVRWVAGVVAGAFAGVIALVLAMIMASAAGYEFLFPAKLMGTILLGAEATASDAGVAPVIVGFVIFELVAMLWGFVFGHFTRATNALPALLGVGLAWAAFSWVFIWCLFLQSFRPIFVANLNYGAAIPVCLAYGLGLTSVAFFDRMIRGNR